MIALKVLFPLIAAGAAMVLLAVGPALADGASYTYDPLGRLVGITYDNGTSVSYHYDAAGNRILVSVSGAVAQAVLHGRITLPGRPAPPDATWQVPLLVNLLQPGTSTVVQSASPTTDTSGAFAVSPVTPSSYDVQVKFASALSKVARNVTVVAGDNPSISFGSLAMGDVNNDDAVDLLDFSTLRTTFGQCTGASGFDARADLNGDGCVDLLDFSLLRTSFGQFGPQVIS